MGPPCDGRSSLGQLRGLRAARRRRRGQRTDGTVCGQRTTVGAGADKAPWYAANALPRGSVQRRSVHVRIRASRHQPGCRSSSVWCWSFVFAAARRIASNCPCCSPAVAGRRFQDDPQEERRRDRAVCLRRRRRVRGCTKKLFDDVRQLLEEDGALGQLVRAACPCRSRRAHRRRAGRPLRSAAPGGSEFPHRPWSRRRSRHRSRPPAPPRRRRRRRRSSACAGRGVPKKMLRRAGGGLLFGGPAACWAVPRDIGLLLPGRGGRAAALGVPKGSEGKRSKENHDVRSRRARGVIIPPFELGSVLSQVTLTISRPPPFTSSEHGRRSSTISFASLSPRPVSARTSLMTLIFALASKLVSLMSKNLLLRGSLGRRERGRAAATTCTTPPPPPPCRWASLRPSRP